MKNSMNIIAHIETVYKTKFGVPRQAGLVDVPSRIVFLPEYRVPEAVRGLEGFEYIWLIWGFHLAEREQWSPTVRPPRLGGNKRVGVFATRSPFRPNPIGLSSVRLLSVTVESGLGPVITVSGADLVDGTPIYDIKPYIAYADSHPDAHSGFAQESLVRLAVNDPDSLLVNLLIGFFSFSTINPYFFLSSWDIFEIKLPYFTSNKNFFISFKLLRCSFLFEIISFIVSI